MKRQEIPTVILLTIFFVSSVVAYMVSRCWNESSCVIPAEAVIQSLGGVPDSRTLGSEDPVVSVVRRLRSIYCILSTVFCILSSRSGMILLMDLLQPLPRDMGVNLGRGNVCVAEHDLHGPQVRTMFEQVACKGMPQGVRRDLLSDSGQSGAPLDDLPEGLPAHGFCPRSQKEMRRTPFLQKARAAVQEVLFDGLLSL